MSAHNLHLDKIQLINWITRLQDTNMIEKLKQMQTANETIEVPEWHQSIVAERKKTAKKEYTDLADIDANIKLG